ncbi:BTAD domain-containing putative transcriptional regulator [Streptomyces sp. SID13031]|uniref:AfsR/SARP family transcriptional regulator n=1 Tax=Streptomyces sp. SID13031 TaxID=2706046 RepID=UPI0013C829F6|nr:BTAD domain-containing putative transcriptional regulator [Streptomyces sp. SID13031]NEA30237.1 SARP family transcriptional regulator [Streptomyces sp. SID13031]
MSSKSPEPGNPDPETLDEENPEAAKLRLLDGFRVVVDQQTLSIPLSARRVVAYVALRGRSSRAEVAGTLWPEVSDSKAQACLRTALWRLRQLSRYPLVTGDETLRLDESLDVDVSTLVTAIRRVINDGECGADQGLLPTLATMGELLPGWYDDWVLLGRERLRQLQLHALELTAQALTCDGRYAEAIEAAMAAVRLEPLRESATRVLIEVHLAEDNVVEALRRLEFFRKSLESELGVEPTAELVDLVRSRQTVSHARRAVPEMLRSNRHLA